MDLKVGYVCDRGLSPKRPVNQDRFLAIPERGLFAVFDGVGGQRAGEVASQTAAETIEEALAHNSDGSSVELIRRAIDFATATCSNWLKAIRLIRQWRQQLR